MQKFTQVQAFPEKKIEKYSLTLMTGDANFFKSRRDQAWKKNGSWGGRGNPDTPPVECGKE